MSQLPMAATDEVPLIALFRHTLMLPLPCQTFSLQAQASPSLLIVPRAIHLAKAFTSKKSASMGSLCQGKTSSLCFSAAITCPTLDKSQHLTYIHAPIQFHEILLLHNFNTEITIMF